MTTDPLTTARARLAQAQADAASAQAEIDAAEKSLVGKCYRSGDDLYLAIRPFGASGRMVYLVSRLSDSKDPIFAYWIPNVGFGTEITPAEFRAAALPRLAAIYEAVMGEKMPVAQANECNRCHEPLVNGGLRDRHDNPVCYQCYGETETKQEDIGLPSDPLAAVRMPKPAIPPGYAISAGYEWREEVRPPKSGEWFIDSMTIKATMASVNFHPSMPRPILHPLSTPITNDEADSSSYLPSSEDQPPDDADKVATAELSKDGVDILGVAAEPIYGGHFQ